ncbi:tRNA (uridine(34)/cytosine(34)/5-carboxymethylaminomethyluridine(34)-2'-O)-methyltransferase TrmL [Aliibacillus thermotolerans]|uniref:Putative tRNA (cytidine(34)-2'-O)-methyltransferase n=1 Tax=Aliibacillus thermotolerans TaxID=1834418 RepID=A0ABW0U5F4_9BACI|nr:tRNA (uridine(34)/cytosine(34)/5-carboxymethylaminomethyluridine(34)-2'-O)-methyltransferase TrmL [Aliibacillus thermotolerans]MDA3128546.1 tRNA (uridine(34)/cytosine(34)/5-carboxymethylaminomethyluridine(34)-2'-O)-methyltransferase TrmL [Aliibacillus thermotolerans]
MGNHIVLYQPEIPANTGNIARTCAGTGTTLHLIRPLGFSTDDKMLKRAGCDYWPYVNIHYYDAMEELFATYPEGEFYFIETIGRKNYTDVSFSDPTVEYFFVFGRETSGLPSSLTSQYEDRCLRIPQNDRVRSLNLSNTAAIVVYEALRQQQFAPI